jgi:hypothetical protein
MRYQIHVPSESGTCDARFLLSSEVRLWDYITHDSLKGAVTVEGFIACNNWMKTVVSIYWLFNDAINSQSYSNVSEIRRVNCHTKKVKKSKAIPVNRPWRPIGL